MARLKAVYVDKRRIGFASSWSEVATLIGAKHSSRLAIEVRAGSATMHETPRAFYVSTANDAAPREKNHT